ncbi:MAG TPA: hypothetical protein V6C97_26715 [Oculatellaceae cyanobacterium]|jgi:hypothetical protein|nr:hypothetical protein [Cyanobacteria bacterium SZAS LIN-5]
MAKIVQKSVRTHMDRNGIIVFSLVQGTRRPRIVQAFGYGTCSKLWLKFHDLGDGVVGMSAESPQLVKEEIASWVR